MDPLSIIGAISAIASLAGAGAKLSIFLFEVSSAIGSAGDEVRDLGIEISLFCAVLRQLQQVLSDAKGRRSSLTAVDTTQQIIDRTKNIFRNIELIIKSLHVDTSRVGEVALDLRARLRWTFKKNKIQTHRATLESCKITLTLMVNTLTYAGVISSRRFSNEKTDIEDAEEEAIAQSLASAQQRANERLASIEQSEEDEEGNPEGEDLHSSPPPYQDPISAISAAVSQPEPTYGPTPTAAQRLESEASLHLPIQRPTERASVWLNKLTLDEISPVAALSRRGSAVSTESVARHRQVELLLFRWTDQGEHWASLQHHGHKFHEARGAPPPPGELSMPKKPFMNPFTTFNRVDSVPISPGSTPATEPKHGILGFDSHGPSSAPNSYF